MDKEPKSTLKTTRILFNLAFFLVVVGFTWYMVASINNDILPDGGAVRGTSGLFSSPYKQVASFKLPEEINRFELYDNKLFISAGQLVYIYHIEGNRLGDFPVGLNVRDITVAGDEIYLLYPTRIEVFSMSGEPIRQWEACSNLSDYCSFAIAGNAVFVTDAANKEICKYITNGDFVKFIQSPRNFIIPSYTFDIDCYNDTIYCANSGRHSVETYTLNGDFIAASGAPGSEAGFFSGCCNPAYISFTSGGTLITSEKGNPRISCYGRNGRFRSILLDSKALGGGNKAYPIKPYHDKLLVAAKNRIITFQYDPKADVSACSGCAVSCPLRR
jgi:hypothetical protein